MQCNETPAAYDGDAAPDGIFAWLVERSLLMACRDLSSSQFRKLIHPVQAWKKTRVRAHSDETVLVELLLPAGTVVYSDCMGTPRGRYSSTTISMRKMRANQAEVVSQLTLPGSWHMGGREVSKSVSAFSATFEYINGYTVKPSSPFSPYYDQCDPGIHFFLRRGDAEVYEL